MSNYLTHLAVRTIGSGTEIKPRVSAWFEPAHELGWMQKGADDDGQQQFQGESDRAWRDMPPTRSTVTNLANVASEPEVRSSTMENPRPRLHEAQEHHERQQPKEEGWRRLFLKRTSISDQGQLEPPLPPPTISSPTKPQIHRKVESAPISPITVERLQLHNSPVAPQPHPQEAHHDIVSKVSIAEREMKTTEREGRMLPIRPLPKEPTGQAMPSPRLNILPEETNREHAPWQRRRSEIPGDSEPTIHITIGRVDVRAVTPSSMSTAKESTRRPAMGLEEYLARRGNKRP